MFFDVLTSLMVQKNITRQQLTDMLHIGKNQIKYWETRGTIPNGETLKKIADYFGVSVDYLLGNEEAQKNTAPALSADEQYIIDVFRSLNRHGQAFLLESAENAKENPKYKKKYSRSFQE